MPRTYVPRGGPDTAPSPGNRVKRGPARKIDHRNMRDILERAIEMNSRWLARMENTMFASGIQPENRADYDPKHTDHLVKLSKSVESLSKEFRQFVKSEAANQKALTKTEKVQLLLGLFGELPLHDRAEALAQIQEMAE